MRRRVAPTACSRVPALLVVAFALLLTPAAVAAPGDADPAHGGYLPTRTLTLPPPVADPGCEWMGSIAYYEQLQSFNDTYATLDRWTRTWSHVSAPRPDAPCGTRWQGFFEQHYVDVDPGACTTRGTLDVDAGGTGAGTFSVAIGASEPRYANLYFYADGEYPGTETRSLTSDCAEPQTSTAPHNDTVAPTSCYSPIPSAEMQALVFRCIENIDSGTPPDYTVHTRRETFVRVRKTHCDTNVDSDGDGASDCAEYDRNTDPAVADGEPPKLGVRAVGSVVSGTVYVTTPGGRRRALGPGEAIPLGSSVDARRGTVHLVLAAGPGQPDMAGDFSDGVFVLTQLTKPKVTTVLRLSEPLACAARGSRSATSAKRRKRRQLWGDGHGSFRTQGKHSSATVRGTRWLVRDTCTTTLTRVARGVVEVRDQVKRRTVVVRAGGSYTARRR